ncbi:hypothetical protein ACH3XX_42475 [Streptomyces scabiei]|uniref:hypothetical protein n=1 Tax=Streptomyces scabiei TaxID=1930 RepID=UPI0007659EA1|nr:MULTISPECIES: hypothetical protein [Streptomyces]MBP5915856.1 hypothetical protein [Streptomyces sp. LBUM 1486]MDX2626472.1 hypothetical protein [Streptomyces scabiei]MDX3028604.1 hypothetical protein [Streptomyces scabiei]MDX3168297.1 hypothetical protein [Streptomyces scabiei]MDX3207326.1 hypothetical protein [Streptomyces scabiei]
MTTLASMTVRLGIDTDQLQAGADKAKKVLTSVGKAVAGLGIGVPVAAAVAAGVGAMAASFVSAGIAAKAFQLAVGPQMEAVAEVATLAEEAEKAAAEGAEDAAEKQKAYTDALAQLPPATRETAKEFIGLKKDFSAWSDSLSGTTMPVFTKGLQLLRRLLPALTPFAKAGAQAFGEFIDEIDRSTKGKGLQAFADSMAKVAGKNLKSFLFGLKNIAVGIGGIIKAFLPLSTTMSGGFEAGTAAFARWGQSLEGSQGFADFIALAREGATTLGQVATAALNLLVALGPLIGVSTQVALVLARIINALPPDVLSAIATGAVSIAIGMKLWAAGAKVVAVANTVMASSTYRAIAGWTRMMAVGLGAYARIAAAAVASSARTAAAWVRAAAASVAAFVRMAIAATVSAARTAAAWLGSALAASATWVAAVVRAGITSAATFLMMAARAVVWAATMAASWIMAMGPVGWIIAAVIALAVLIYAYWDEIKAFTIAAWNAVWTWIKGVAQKVWDLFLSWTIAGLIIKHWDTIKSKTIAAWNAIVAWVKQIPGWIYNAFLNWTALGLLIKHWSAMKNATVRKATELINWVKGIPGRVRSGLGNLGNVLTGAGRALIQGFINGIKNMLGSVKNAAGSIVSAARDYFPFSPAKTGPFAGKGYTLYSGMALADAFGQGITDGVPGVQSALDGMATVPGLRTAARIGAGGGPAAQATRVIVEVAGPEAVKQIIRAIVIKDGGGNVQKALGKAKSSA